MNLEHVKTLLKKHEGFSNVPYKCPANRNTIGYGHNFDANPLPPDIKSYLGGTGTILPEMAERLLEADINNALKDCHKLYPKFDTFPDNVQDALVDFLFNVGIGTATKFKHMNFYLNSLDFEAAAMELVNSAWYHQVGNRAEEIVEMIKEG